MSLKPETIAQIQAMLTANPAVVTQLQSAADNASAVATLAAAAAGQGISVTAPDLIAHLQGAPSKQADMSDADLEEVAGGFLAAVGANGQILGGVLGVGPNVSLFAGANLRDCISSMAK